MTDVTHVSVNGRTARCGVLHSAHVVSLDRADESTCRRCRRLLGLQPGAHAGDVTTAEALDALLNRLDDVLIGFRKAIDRLSVLVLVLGIWVGILSVVVWIGL